LYTVSEIDPRIKRTDGSRAITRQARPSPV
jgi:hypothetical protein